MSGRTRSSRTIARVVGVVRVVAAAVLAAQPALAQAPTPAPAGALPAIKPLGKVIASSKELLGAVSQVRALPDGRVLVNDNAGRKVALFDASLTASVVIADTTSATANAYSSRAGGLIAYRGDSTLFVDPQSLSMLVLDGKGQVVRVMSVPRPNDAFALVGGQNGTPGFDAQGRLVYRGAPNIKFSAPARGSSGSGMPAFTMPDIPDSVAVVRIDLESRKLDTVADVKTTKVKMSVNQSAEGRMSISSVTNPMQYIDDWAVTSDGRVAVVRGQEYRVDWIGADDKVESTSKIPFAWRHLDDSAKTVFLDSTRAAMEKMREQAIQRMQQGAGPAGALGGGGSAPAAAKAGAEVAMTFMVRGGDGGTANGPPARGNTGNATPTLPPIQLVSASELPDYAPPFNSGSVRGDEDGNVWIRTTNVYNGGSVYDVVNGKGQLTDRILLPPGRVIAGFAKGGIVYMGVRDGDGVRLEKATVR